MLRRASFFCVLAGALCALAGADGPVSVDTSQLPDRCFLTPDVWPNPWENWSIENGEMVTVHASPHRPMTMHHLTMELTGAEAGMSMSVNVRRRSGGDTEGSAGFCIGIRVDDPIDDYRSRLLFGEGLYLGLTTKGDLFIGETRHHIGALADWNMGEQPVRLTMTVRPNGDDRFKVALSASSEQPQKQLGFVETTVAPAQLAGNVALVAGMPKGLSNCSETALWAFGDWRLDGPKFMHHPGRCFGPILWSQYTLSGNMLNLTAQLAPIGKEDCQTVGLEVRKNGQWTPLTSATVEDLSWTAPFRIEGWNASEDTPYRLVWPQMRKDGSVANHYWEGVIRRDPVDKSVVQAGLFCCFMDYVFPNRCVAENVARQDPDLLFFVGDQIYEGVGGWGILRTGPLDRMCVNYLRKLALWGWSFRDLMRDRPTVTMPDDHDVYQGNIWGDAGRKIPLEQWNQRSGYGDSKNVGSVGGYVQPIEFVKAVERTQVSHLPECASDKTFKQGLEGYFTSMTYGGVGFAIIEDRKFKTGPQQIATPHGGPRPDHISEPGMAEVINDPDAKLLGDEQLAFLRGWACDWTGQQMKAAVSQTVYCGVATHHGSSNNFLLGDMDSGGWPQAGRNKAVDVLRRAGAVLLAGDQHLPTVVRHGIDFPGDAMVSFVTPAGAVGYQRWWLPEESGMQRIAGGRHEGRPNTGLYRDGFGNLVDVLAVGNPPKDMGRPPNRETMAMRKSSGWGIVAFDKPGGTIRFEAWRVRPGLNVNENAGPDDQFPGWPMTIAASGNYGVTALKLPRLTLDKSALSRHPVVRVKNAQGGLVSAGRPAGGTFTATVYEPGEYTVEVIAGDGSGEVLARFEGVKPGAKGPLRTQD